MATTQALQANTGGTGQGQVLVEPVPLKHSNKKIGEKLNITIKSIVKRIPGSLLEAHRAPLFKFLVVLEYNLLTVALFHTMKVIKKNKCYVNVHLT